jgi:DNA invertase Pin-like site-specific DNA recombinase
MAVLLVSMDLFALATVPAGPDEAGGPPPTKFYRRRDNVEACARRASALGAELVEEFMDRGISATSTRRPGLQAMLTRLAEGGIDYVIVHKVDRLARNRADHVAIVMAIREAGAQLVSTSENVDETPSGLLLHGIMSSIAEFYSKNLATEIIKGSTQKAKGRHPVQGAAWLPQPPRMDRGARDPHHRHRPRPWPADPTRLRALCQRRVRTFRPCRNS